MNGLMVSLGRVPSLVVTLATLYIIRGIDILIVGGNEVVAQSLPAGFFANIPQDTVLGVPDLAIVVAVIVAAGAYYMRSFRSGRELYAIGSNPDAARLACIPVGKRIFTAFAVSGALAGLGGVLWAAQYQTVDSTAGTGYELPAIAAVVVGGVAIFGGSGNRDRGGDRRAAAEHDPVGPQCPGHRAVLGPGDRRSPAAGGDHHRPGDIAPAGGRAATKELSSWNLSAPRPGPGQVPRPGPRLATRARLLRCPEALPRGNCCGGRHAGKPACWWWSSPSPCLACRPRRSS